MNSAMTYEKLYSNMVKKFTVEKNNTDYKLCEYMLMKANAKKTTAASNLPAVRTAGGDTRAITAFFSYVSDKLQVKEAPIRDKTIRAFPMRTSLTAFCSALIMCAVVFTCGIFGLSSIEKSGDAEIGYAEIAENYEAPENEARF